MSTTVLAVDFTHDGAIAVDTSQIRNTSDGDNPGRAWEAFLPFPAPVTVNGATGAAIAGPALADQGQRRWLFQVGTRRGSSS
jgi:hypothetical protein